MKTAITGFCLLFATLAGFAEIQVLNGSFETPSVTATSPSQYGDDWVRSAPSAPGSATALVVNGDRNLPDTPHGRQYVFLCGRKSAGATGSPEPNRLIQQISGKSGQVSFEAGQKVVLTVALVDALNTPSNFSFGFYSDPALTKPLSERDASTVKLMKQFEDFSVEWTVLPREAGKDVYIGFKTMDYGTSSSTPRLGIDHVRLQLAP